MNIIIIMSGGVGARFGAPIPKQYNMIAGKPVIEYVMDAAEASKKADKIVVVMDSRWLVYSKRLLLSGYDIAPNGDNRVMSLYNGMSLIHEKYPCKNIVVIDAVAPLITGEIIDDYFEKLDEYDAVITAQKITGGFTDIYDNRLDREKYIITQSPEGFRFSLLWDNFKKDFPYQETAGMLPDGSKRYYNYGFRNNLKLTYDYEITFAEVMLGRIPGRIEPFETPYFSKEILITDGIRENLVRNEPALTEKWIDDIYSVMPELIKRWKVTSFLPNQISRYGLVLQAKSEIYGNVILKFIPEFVRRFERELEAMRILSDTFMCGLIDADENARCMLLKMVVPSEYARYEETEKLDAFFELVKDNAVMDDGTIPLRHIPLYFDELKFKLGNVGNCPYCADLIRPELTYAVRLYKETFIDSPLYILHGDLHELNILDDGKRFWGIDPNGMHAPIEMEYVRFIRNDVRNHADIGYRKRMDLLVDFFSRFADVSRLLKFFIIDMAFCTYNSTFENEDPAETYVDLELIKIAKEMIDENNF